MKHALLVKMSSLGDVVHALPAVSDAAAQGWTFDWVVEEAFADIPALHPAVKQVLPIAWRRWRKSLLTSRAEMRGFKQALQAQEYSVIIDSQGLLKSAAVAGLAQGPTIGFSLRTARESWSAFAYRQRVLVPQQQHAIVRQRQLFAAALGYPLPSSPALGVDRTREPVRQVFLLHGTTWASKHWPDMMWAELIRLVKADGYEAMVTWGDDNERARAEHLAQFGATVLPRVSIAELADRLSASALVVTVDSGLGHLSAALGVPTIGLYGATDGELTGCHGANAINLQGTAHCAPCLRKTCKRYQGEEILFQEQAVQPPCFGAVTPASVWTRAQDMLCA